MLIGNGALANYHNLEDTDRADFERWHTAEHIPERVGVPGFMRGRRYVGIDETTRPQYFILYEGSEVEVFCAPDYLARLNAPTSWTQAVSATMTLTLRTACTVTHTEGQGVGDYCGTWQLSPADDRAGLRSQLVKRVFPSVLDISDVLAIHLLEANPAVTAVDTKEKGVRQGDDGMSDWIVMVEADTADTFDAVFAMLEHNVHTKLVASEWATYQLQAMQRDIAEL